MATNSPLLSILADKDGIFHPKSEEHVIALNIKLDEIENNKVVKLDREGTEKLGFDEIILGTTLMVHERTSRLNVGDWRRIGFRIE